MALTMKELQKLVEGEDFRYFVDPTRDALMLGASGLNGTYQFIILLEVQGQFVQFRTIGYLHCPADHPNLKEVLEVLGELNYSLRLVKFARDPSDGEIVAYADVWVMDGTLTQKQFGRMIHNFLPSIDLNSDRIKRTLETGEDPGELDPQTLMERLLGEAGLPPKLRDKIRELEEQKKEKSKKKGPSKVKKI
jgi:hypothetical protein